MVRWKGHESPERTQGNGMLAKNKNELFFEQRNLELDHVNFTVFEFRLGLFSIVIFKIIFSRFHFVNTVWFF